MNSQAMGPVAPRHVLQPRVVHLLCGLRRHQVEEAVQLLLDYADGFRREATTQCGGLSQEVVEALSVATEHQRWQVENSSRLLLNLPLASMEPP